MLSVRALRHQKQKFYILQLARFIARTVVGQLVADRQNFLCFFSKLSIDDIESFQHIPLDTTCHPCFSCCIQEHVRIFSHSQRFTHRLTFDFESQNNSYIFFGRHHDPIRIIRHYVLMKTN